MSAAEEIQVKIDRFERLLADTRSTDEEKDRYKVAIVKFKEMKKEAEGGSDDKGDKKDKPEPKEPKDKKEPKKPESKSEPKKPESKDKKQPSKKGLVVLSAKRVSIDGKEVSVDSQEFCDYLTGQWYERREKARANKDKKKKTESVMEKVTKNISKGITTAIKTGIKDNKDIIEKNPRVFITKVEKLETATKNFMQNLKEVLGDEYDAKEVTQTTNAIQEMIDGLKEKYGKKK